MESFSNELSNLVQKIQEISDEYSDMKEIFFDEYNTELLEDSIKSLKLLNNSRKAFSMMKFRYFLKGLNLNTMDSKNIEKLTKYIDNQEKAEFVTNCFDKILASNSKKSCCLIGIMLNDMIKNKKSVEQENLMILQALAMMNDFDIKNFVCLFKCVLNEKRNKSIRISDNIIGNCIGQYNLTENNIILLKIILN